MGITSRLIINLGKIVTVPEASTCIKRSPFRLAKPFLLPSFQSVIRSGIHEWENHASDVRRQRMRLHSHSPHLANGRSIITRDNPTKQTNYPWRGMVVQLLKCFLICGGFLSVSDSLSNLLIMSLTLAVPTLCSCLYVCAERTGGVMCRSWTRS